MIAPGWFAGGAPDRGGHRINQKKRTAMTRQLSSHQTTSKVSDALREQYDSKSKDPTEPPKLIADLLDAGSTVRRHQLLGPETATPRRWVNDARPDKKRPHWRT